MILTAMTCTSVASNSAKIYSIHFSYITTNHGQNSVLHMLKCFSFWGTLSPQTLYWSFAPKPHWGNSVTWVIYFLPCSKDLSYPALVAVLHKKLSYCSAEGPLDAVC